jgi:MoxR-like ATPase
MNEGPGSSNAAERILQAIGDSVLGEREAAEILLTAYMAGGHALIEGIPGIGKTLLARVFATTLDLAFSRIQFTPDLMPSDVTGGNVYDSDRGTFRLVRGPVFTDVLMADEINRTPPRTQSALLEAMQEGQVTIDGETLQLASGFFVIATQNPVEFEGTYPLPEAQLDRFLVRIEMGLPSAEAELEIYRRASRDSLGGWSAEAPLPGPQIDARQAAELRRASRGIHAEDEVLGYLHALADAVRTSPDVELGVSPRGALALLELARSWATLDGREFITPDDIRRGLHPCWGHRVLLVPESELEGVTVRRVLDRVAESVDVPH